MVWLKFKGIFISLKPILNSIFLLFFYQANCFPQASLIPLDRSLNFEYDGLAASQSFPFHSTVKPFLSADIKKGLNVDSINNSRGIFAKFHHKQSGKDSLEIQSLQGDKLRYIEAFPLFYLQSGYEKSGAVKNNFAGTAIGASINASVTGKLFVNANFISANADFPLFVGNYIDSMKVVPGEGYAYPTSLGHHYKNSSGYVSYSPVSTFNFQLGHGKNFFGDGYRSLLLSDVANNYSFFKITTSIWKIKYINLFANFKDVSFPAKDYWHFKDKYGTFHYLSWNLSNWFNLGLFESVIWQGKDTLNNRGFDVNYLNPVIFYRPVEYSVGSADNSLMGLNLKFRIAKKIQIYSQFVLDEFLLKEIRARNGWWANKYGGQFGIKYFNAFGVKGFSMLAELNEVRPFTYSHGSPMQNYAHYNQPLAHPLGANFSEILGIAGYQKNIFSIELKSVISKYGADSPGKNFGGDIYKSYTSMVQIYGNKTGQGIPNYLFVSEITGSCLIVPSMNLKMEIGALYRVKYSQNEFVNNAFFHLGLKTCLYNIYRDFI